MGKVVAIVLDSGLTLDRAKVLVVLEALISFNSLVSLVVVRTTFIPLQPVECLSDVLLTLRKAMQTI